MLSRVVASAAVRSIRPDREIVALAITPPEDDARIYRAYADGLHEQFPQSAKVFEELPRSRRSDPR